MVRVITDESRIRTAKVIELVHGRGMSYGNAASKLGITRSTVAGIMYRAGLTNSDSEKVKPVKVSLTFPSIEQAAREMGVNHQTIRNNARNKSGGWKVVGAEGVETWHQIKKRHLQEKVDAVTARIDAGNTIEQAASALNMTPIALAEFCQRYGVKWTSPGEVAKRKSKQLVEHRRKLAMQGVSMKDAARQAGISRNSMYAFSLKHNIKWEN